MAADRVDSAARQPIAPVRPLVVRGEALAAFVPLLRLEGGTAVGAATASAVVVALTAAAEAGPMAAEVGPMAEAVAMVAADDKPSIGSSYQSERAGAPLTAAALFIIDS